MNVLLIGSSSELLHQHVVKHGDVAIRTDDKIDATFIQENRIDFVVSYGFRHMIRKDVLDLLPGKVINLHISLLPWNKGADPNFWSFVDDTPKGVTIHQVDEGLDTGAILAQIEMSFSNSETLRSSYEKLSEAMVNLFEEKWESIKKGIIEPKPQQAEGTFHLVKHKTHLVEVIGDSWLDLPVEDWIEKVRNLNHHG